MPRDVVARASRLAQRFREAGAPVVFVRVTFSADDGDRLKLKIDEAAPVTLPPQHRHHCIGGIATNFGVESTARSAHEHAYQLIFAEDAMSGLKPSAHEFAVQNIFPRLGLVRTTEQILAAISAR